MPGTESSQFKGPWPKGMNNRLRDAQLPKDALRNAVNVNIDAAGGIASRTGYTEAVTGDFHSLWSEGDITLCVKDNVLKQLAVDPAGVVTETTLRSGMTAGAALAYVLVNGSVYYSNAVQTGRITAGVNYPWGIEHASVPLAAAITSGGLAAGRYQVAITYVAADGEEGGTSTSVAVQVAAGGGIQLSGIPQASSSHVTVIRVYVTSANGSLFYHHADIADGTTSLTIAASSTLGQALQTWDMYPAPPGDVLELHNGAIWIANGLYLWFTEPLYYGQYRKTNLYVFPSPISILARLSNSALAVASDKHYVMQGNSADDVALNPVHHFAGVKGTQIKLPDGVSRAWVTPEGFMMSDGSGAMTPRLTENVFIDEATVGAALYREHEGVTQIIAALQDGASSAGAAQDYFDCEVIRAS